MEAPEGRLSRRRVLQVGGALAAAAGAVAAGFDLGTAEGRTAAPSPATTKGPSSSSTTATVAPRFVSRPDLEPPHLAMTGSSARMSPGHIFLTPAAGAIQPGALIARDDGEPVWFRPLPAGVSATNLRVQSYRGAPVLTWWEGVVGDGWGRGHGVVADGSYREITRLAAGNGLSADLHDFVLTPQGTALLAVYHPDRGDLSAVGGPTSGYFLDSGVQEIDLTTGDVRLEWLAASRIPLEETVNPLAASGTKPDAPFDPFHANSVTLDADGDLLVSFRHLSAVLKIGRDDGAVRWRLGGLRSDYGFAPGSAFSWQHHAARQADGTITVFDNGGSAQQEEHPSRGLRLQVDDRARSVTAVGSFGRAEPTLALSQGNLQVLPDGGVFVGWGAEPFFNGFDTGGTMLLEGTFVEATSSYRAFRYQWTGTPADRPVVAARSRADGGTDVFASWNGATEVARWQVLAGSAAGSLDAVTTVVHEGFETTAPIAGRPAYLAVAALDATGRELGRSEPLRA